MRLATYHRRSLWHYRRTNLAVVLGAAVATSALTGALIVGDSMRASLRDVALGRLGKVDHALVAQRFFREALAAEIAKGSPFSQSRIKALVYEGLGSEVGPHMQRHTKALAECFKSSDHQEGVAAFLERREAEFTGT